MHSKLSSVLPLFVGITAGVATSQDAPRTAIPAASVPSAPPPAEALPTETTPPKALPVNDGTLNADFTPNEATAERFGWELAEAGTAVAKRAELEAGSKHQQIDMSRTLGQVKDSVPRSSGKR